jgi:hypothetical protein
MGLAAKLCAAAVPASNTDTQAKAAAAHLFFAGAMRSSAEFFRGGMNDNCGTELLLK